jgi:hypothetical protein
VDYKICTRKVKKDPFRTSRSGQIPLAARSKAGTCGSSLAGIVGSNIARGIESVCFECCVLSGSGPCVGSITHPEEPY